MIILGIDPGTKTGWAICVEGKIVESGVQTFDLGRGESPGMRFLRFRQWLRQVTPVQLWANTDQHILAYERAHHRGGAATEIGVGFCTRIQEFAAEQGYESMPVHTATLKKWATGSGRADKSVMIAAAMERILKNLCTHEIPSGRRAPEALGDDEADAILIALWAWSVVGLKS